MYYTIGGEMYHHQRLGAKWGVMHGPPYPLERGEFSKPGKKLKKGNVMDYLKSRKRKKQQRKALEKARETKRQNAEKRQTEEEHAAARDKAFRSGSAEEVMKYKGEFTAAQLQEVINRLNNEQKLSEMSKKDVKTVTDKVDDIVNKIDKVRGWTEKGVSAYNTAAKIINAFSDESDLPIIGTDNKNTRANRDLESKNKQLDNALKKLQNENQKLKNEGQSLSNQDQSLKNQQSAWNLLKQIEKSEKSENKNNDTKKNETNKKVETEQNDSKNKDSGSSLSSSKTPFEKAAEDHKKATDEALKKIDEAEKKKKKKK